MYKDFMQVQLSVALKTLVTCFAVVLFSGCATNEVPITAESEQAADNYEYVIGAGDSLSIFVWGYPDLSVTLPVRPDGKITTRLAEDINASGKTPTQLAREIEDVYQEFVKQPTVTVSVSSFIGSPEQHIKVVGGGAKPKIVQYKNGMTLLDLMVEVGGLDKFASGNKSKLVRKEGGKDNSYKVRLHDLLKKGDISANVRLVPGDILIIPESWF